MQISMQIRKCGPFAISIQIGHRRHIWGIGPAECSGNSHRYYGDNEIIVHNGITSMKNLGEHSDATSIRIPFTMLHIPNSLDLECIVSKKNLLYASQDGVLFSKDMSELVAFPKGRQGTYCIPDSVQRIRRFAFSFSKLSSVIISESVHEIGWDAFQYCNSLQTVHIPSNVKEISGWAFSYCENLHEVLIDDGIKSIANGAFYGCSKLRSVSIPDTVEYIQVYAFDGCNGMLVHVHPGESQRQFYKDGDHWEWEPGELLLETKEKADDLETEVMASSESTGGKEDEIDWEPIDPLRASILKDLNERYPDPERWADTVVETPLWGFVTNSTDGITQAQQNALRRKTIDKLNKLSPEQTENILDLLREQKNSKNG